MNGHPWTDAELEVLRTMYARRTRDGRVRWAKVEAQLPGRSRAAIIGRALTLRRAERGRVLVRKSAWTDAENATLVREWSEVGRRTLRAHLPGRTWCGILNRAQKLGLDAIPQGWMSVQRAADKAGFQRSTLVRVIAWANARELARRAAGGQPEDDADVGVYVRQHAGAATRAWGLVEWDAVERAVTAWLRTETVAHAAVRLGVSRFALRDWLALDGVCPPARRRVVIRLDPEVYDRVARAHARPAPVRCAPVAQAQARAA